MTATGMAIAPAICSGRLPGIPGQPMGQCTWANLGRREAALLQPVPPRAHLVRLPIRPMKGRSACSR